MSVKATQARKTNEPRILQSVMAVVAVTSGGGPP